MPTGYTAGVQDGTITDFKEFALKCSRAFGACVMQRDDDPNQPPKKQEPSSYYLDSYIKARDGRISIQKLTKDEILQNYLNEKKKSLDDYFCRTHESILQKKRYENMLEKVNDWCPPTKDHCGMKDFMIKQLTESIDFDCDLEYVEENYEKTLDHIKNPPAPEEILKEHLDGFQKDMDYYWEEHQKELKRTKERNDWIDDLYKSLH